MKFLAICALRAAYAVAIVLGVMLALIALVEVLS